MPISAAPAVPVSGNGKTVLIVLAVVFGLLLALAVGIYAAFRTVVNKVSALANGDVQSTQQSRDASASAGGDQQGARATGNVIGNMLGTDAKGKSDIGNALNNMVKAGGQIEQHDKASGNIGGVPDASDTQQAMGAAGGLLSALGSSLGGAHRHDPVDFHTLEALLPSALPGMQRAEPRGSSNQAMGIKTASADVDFHGPDNASINVSIKDATAVSGLAGLAAMADADESEQGDSYEKNESIDGHSVHEKWDAQGRHGLLSLIVARRFGVDLEGDNVDMAALKSALAQIDLGKLESMKDVNPQAQ
ncbi:MAG: hypothetical protein ABI178_06505 [Rhodanobacter sp.]